MYEGYGLYIWPCYILLLLLISWQLRAAIKQHITMRRNLRRSLQAELTSDQQT